MNACIISDSLRAWALGTAIWLPGNTVDALPGFGLRGLDLFTSLAAQDADEAAHRVRLPISGFHDLRQGGAVRALQHGDDLGLFVAWLGGSFTYCSLRLRRLLRGLGLLRRSVGFDRARVHRVSPDRVAVMTIHHSGPEKTSRQFFNDWAEATSGRHRIRGNWRGGSLFYVPDKMAQRIQQMAGHESARTTALYDRRNDAVALDEVERVVFRAATEYGERRRKRRTSSLEWAKWEYRRWASGYPLQFGRARSFVHAGNHI